MLEQAKHDDDCSTCDKQCTSICNTEVAVFKTGECYIIYQNPSEPDAGRKISFIIDIDKDGNRTIDDGAIDEEPPNTSIEKTPKESCLDYWSFHGMAAIKIKELLSTKRT
jgi:hypothetical protein